MNYDIHTTGKHPIDCFRNVTYMSRTCLLNFCETYVLFFNQHFHSMKNSRTATSVVNINL